MDGTTIVKGNSSGINEQSSDSGVAETTQSSIDSVLRREYNLRPQPAKMTGHPRAIRGPRWKATDKQVIQGGLCGSTNDRRHLASFAFFCVMQAV